MNINIKKFGCFCILPFVFTNVLFSEKNIDVHKNQLKSANCKSDTIDFVDSLELINFNVNYSNIALSASFQYNSNVITYSNDINKSKNEMLKGSLINLSESDIYFKTSYDELINGTITYHNGLYSINPKEIEREYDYKEKCKEGRHPFLIQCNLNHLHSKKCIKTEWRECKGCIPTKKILVNKLNFNEFEFDRFFKANNINKDIFDFAKLIEVDYSNSYKFYNRNILSFKFNFDYYKAKILLSYNQYLAHKFYLNYHNKINNNLFEIMYEKIKSGYITDYFHYLPTWLGINVSNFGVKHNITYWLQSMEYKDVNTIIYELNQLEKIHLINYLNVNNDWLTNDYLWHQIYKIFSDNDKLKNIYFKISYNTKLNNSNPPKIISLFELMNSQNNNITYYFSNLNIDHNFEDQAIYITDVSIESNSNNAYINYNNLGLVTQKNIDGSDYKEIPKKQNGESWFKYNLPLDINNILTINSFDKEMSKKYILNKNLSSFASDNRNNLNLVKILTDLKSSPYISLNDKDWLNNLNESNCFLNSDHFKKYISDISLKYYDSIGKIKVIIKLINQKIVSYDVTGFEKKTFQFNVINNEINTDYDGQIDMEFILNNLVCYLNDFDNKKLFWVGTTKEDFIDNILEELNIEYKNNKYIIDIKYKNKLSISEHKRFTLIKNNNSFPNKEQDNGKKTDDNKNNLYFLLFLILPIIAILVCLIIRKKNKKGHLSNDNK